MESVLERGFTAGMIGALVLLVAYQFFMLWWTKRQTGTLPRTITLLRGINIAVLLLAALFIIIWLARG